MYCQISAQISLRAYILHGARHGARDVDCALPAVRLTGGSCAALGGGSARTPRTASWHPSSSAYSARTARDSSGQLWCCPCARCFDGTIIAEPHVSQLLAPGLSPARHSSPLSAAPATTKETSLMAQWLCQKNYQIRAQLVAKMEVSYQLTHGLSISIL